MAKISEYYQIGSRSDLTNERMVEIIEDMYKTLAVAINKKPDFYDRTTDGQTTDSRLAIGTLNQNKNTNKIEMLVQHPTTNTVQWIPLGGSSGGNVLAWAKFTLGFGGIITILASSNIASIVWLGSDAYTFTFSTPVANTNYVPIFQYATNGATDSTSYTAVVRFPTFTVNSFVARCQGDRIIPTGFGLTVIG